MRGFTWADFPAFSAMWQEPEVGKHIPFAPVPPAQNWVRFNVNNSNWTKKGFGSFVVADRAKEFLGTVSLFHGAGSYAKNFDGAIQAGWVFSMRAHGQGFATEAAGLVHHWLDAQPFGGRSVCMMGVGHRGSIRVAEKIGYRSMGIAQDDAGKVQLMERISNV